MARRPYLQSEVSGVLRHTSGTYPRGAVTWDTARDWDQSASELGASHPADSLSFTDGMLSSFEGSATPAPSGWTLTNLADGYSDPSYSGTLGNQNVDAALEGNEAWYIDTNKNNFGHGGGFTSAAKTTLTPATYGQVQWNWCEVSDGNGGCAFWAVDSNGNILCAAGSDNTTTWTLTASGKNNLGSHTNLDYATFVFEPDYSNEEVTITYQRSDGSLSDSRTDAMFQPADDIAELHLGCYGGGHNGKIHFASDVTTTGLPDGEGLWISDVRSFPSAVSPTLDRLDYVLNGGSASIEVVGSPGTSSEERQTVTLDGSDSYPLNFSTPHAEYRVTVSGTPETSINRIELAG